MVLGFVAAGVVIIIFNIVDTQLIPEQLGLIFDVSGMLISSVGVFPIKEIIDKRNKISHVKLLSEQYQKTHIGEKKKIEKLIWRMVEKDALN